jgi:hypothetical protein
MYMNEEYKKHVTSISTLLIDSGAPEPLKNNAWRINREIADSSGVFTTGDEIKVTLLLNVIDLYSVNKL